MRRPEGDRAKRGRGGENGKERVTGRQTGSPEEKAKADGRDVGKKIGRCQGRY